MAARKKKHLEAPTESLALPEASLEVSSTENPESETTVQTLSVSETNATAEAMHSIAQQESAPASVENAESTTHAEPVTGLSKPPGRAWSERFIQPIKYSRSNFKDPTGKHLIAFRFELPDGQTKPSEELLAVLRNHKVFRQGKPVGLSEGASDDPQAVSTGLHYQDFGPGLGKLWVMPNGELGRTVADSLDLALHGLVKKIERGAARQGL